MTSLELALLAVSVAASSASAILAALVYHLYTNLSNLETLLEDTGTIPLSAANEGTFHDRRP